MVHINIELKVHASTCDNIFMKKNELVREEFAKRLKKALSINGKNGWGEGAFLAKITNVTAKASNKWLNAEALPNREKILQLSKSLNVNSLWLEYGEGEITKNEVNLKDADNLKVYNENDPVEDDEIEVPIIKEVELSAGFGRVPVSELKTNSIRFTKTMLIKMGVSFGGAICVYVSGNSMEPFIKDGALVGLDTENTNIIDGKVYAVVIDNELTRVKQLYRLPNNRVRLRSFNRDEYEDEEYSLDDIRVVGKVFWSSVLWD